MTPRNVSLRSMILGVGLDIVHLPRIASLVARRGPVRLARRILSSKELAAWSPDSPEALRFLAVRYVQNVHFIRSRSYTE